MKNEKLSVFAKVTIILCGLALIVVLFVPLWQIELAAPQYPEGLVLKMYPNKLAGNVDIINGLNHYIGMKTLHAKNFIEFTVLPYIIGFFAFLCFLVVVINKRKSLTALLVSFFIFGVISMVDFYRWNYNYGHDLDPNAAIQVPGMSYQPPIFGYKQLLNFGAYSIPDIGGWIFIGVGLLLFVAVITQFIKIKKTAMKTVNKGIVAISSFLIFALISCNSGPEPIQPGKDACSFCKMSIADQRFGAEIVTKKGKVYKFDDMHCIVGFMKSNIINNNDIKETWLINFDEPHNFIPAQKAFLLRGNDLHSPMGGNIANFSDENHLKQAAKKFPGDQLSWNDLLKQQ
ncbi:MAG: nitrous oxide reductase accessory protein NosL [Ginsengibacter sp.]